MSTVICAGHVNWDVTLRVTALPGPDGEAVITEQSQAGGGSASNTAVSLAGLGVDSTLLGSVGNDENGLLVQRELTAVGVDCSPLREMRGEATTVKYIVVDQNGQVMMLANDGVNEAFTASDLDDATLSAADHLHLTGQRPETAAALAERASAAGLSVSLDPGRRVGERDYRTAATYAEYLFLNDREAMQAQKCDLLDAASDATVVIHGAAGSKILDNEQCAHLGYDVNPVDTAGAGDAFAAGFLAATLDDRDHADALAVANACGALASRAVGARTSLTWDTVEQFRAKQTASD